MRWDCYPREGWETGLQEAVEKLQGCCVGRVLWRERCCRVYSKKSVEVKDLIDKLRHIMEAMVLGNLKFGLAVEKRKLWFM
ncbi:unnamed protein product [Linum trigynum]|uniref:Uncharacterized protein n=1 Tax=Linum trigynum TaxID=586398 RepID=A0AAV2G9T5_9ROSI